MPQEKRGHWHFLRSLNKHIAIDLQPQWRKSNLKRRKRRGKAIKRKNNL
jgi:hypothetical protein